MAFPKFRFPNPAAHPKVGFAGGVGEGIPFAAFIGAPVVLEVETGAFVEVPVAEALLASNRSVQVLIVSPALPVLLVNTAFLPRLKIVAGDPPGVFNVVVCVVYVPPAAISTVLILISIPIDAEVVCIV